MFREIHRAAVHIQRAPILLKSFFQAVQIIQLLRVSPFKVRNALNADIMHVLRIFAPMPGISFRSLTGPSPENAFFSAFNLPSLIFFCMIISIPPPSVGGTNSNESLQILHVSDKIILKEATLQSTRRRVVKTFFVLDSMIISVSPIFQAQMSGSIRPYSKNCFNFSVKCVMGQSMASFPF